MTENGWMVKKVDMAYAHTAMEMCMMDSGKMASGVVEANSNISLEMCMMDSGWMVTGWARAPASFTHRNSAVYEGEWEAPRKAKQGAVTRNGQKWIHNITRLWMGQ